jgi:hypothetical protein
VYPPRRIIVRLVDAPICPTSPRCTCTAWDEPGEPARAGWPCRSARTRSGRISRRSSASPAPTSGARRTTYPPGPARPRAAPRDPSGGRLPAPRGGAGRCARDGAGPGCAGADRQRETSPVGRDSDTAVP